jgi:predicted small lipoprotein YifL
MLDSATDFNGAIMRVLPYLFSLLCILFALTACGKKGDLYLPDASAQPQQTQTTK